jgi:hypothetical protein
MHDPAYSPLVEAFLLLEQPRQRLVHWTQALAPLDSPEAPPLASITAFYDPTSDQALLNLRYDEMALGPTRLDYVVECALLAEVGMIQPAELSDGERKRFLGERLARCTIQVTYQRNVIGALTELVRKVKEQRVPSPTGVLKAMPTPKTPPPIPMAARRPARGDTADPVPLITAKGTRDDLRAAVDLLRSDVAQPVIANGHEPPPPPRTDLPRASRRDEAVQTTSRHVVQRSTRAQTVELPPGQAQRLASDSGSHDAEIVDMPPAPESTRRARSPSHLTTDQFLPTAAAAPAPGMIYARYLRSGRWVPIRIGALSLKGAALLAGAMPRLHDYVDVALSFGGHRALVRGAVGKVTNVDEAKSTGAATFSVSFELDDAARRQLTALLTAARAANVTIKPPPPRAAQRFPVEWPVCLGTVRGAIKAEALDVSVDGMFVKPQHGLTLDAVVNFSVVLDDSGPPIAGRAKVVRQIGEADAKTCGLAPGFGLHIVEMSDTDRARWNAFLGRIERRVVKRVLVGASPTRLAELQTTLSAAGYAVIGGTDPGALVQLASAEARPVDAALIDAAWLETGGSASLVENLFSARNVPCVTLHGDSRRARTAVDKLLHVLV